MVATMSMNERLRIQLRENIECDPVVEVMQNYVRYPSPAALATMLKGLY
jgi:hypothetical protein